MDYLLDTHIAIWALDNDPSLSKEAKDIISDNRNSIYFSAISVMEVSIKHQKNPKIMQRSGKDFYYECLDSNYYTLPFKPKHAMMLEDLKVKEKETVNGDPFDKSLIAQAKYEKMILLTSDKVMKHYNEEYIKIV